MRNKVIVKGWVQKDGKFLIAKRANSEKHHQGVWSLPGGKVEEELSDQIIEKTIAREIREEVGLEIDPKIELVYNNGFINTTEGMFVINFTFLCKWSSGKAKTLEDTSEIKWLTLSELNKMKGFADFMNNEIKYLNYYLNHND